MARITVRVSDLSGEQIPDEDSGARLIVEHPDYPEPVGLDVLPDDVEPHLSEENTRFVVVSLQNPENPNPHRYVMSFDDFDRLFQTGDSTSVLRDAFEAQQQERETEISRRGRGRRAVASGTSGTQERVDYTSPNHAGEPHRGTVSEGEKEYVRNNLGVVNNRLREQGHREIDPSDPRMAARYGFPPPVERESPDRAGRPVER
jgi:hypothetical protein